METDRRGLIAAVCFLVLVAGYFLFRFFSGPPQLGPDEDVMKTVDALFTAVTTRDPRRLDDCEKRLNTYRDAGRLAASPARQLDAIIRQARDGKWEPAARRLYDFILGQRGVNVDHRRRESRRVPDETCGLADGRRVISCQCRMSIS